MHERVNSTAISPARRPAGLFFRLFRARALRTLALTAAAFAGGAVTSSLARARSERQSPYAMMDQLARVLVWIENEYVDPVDRAKLIEGGIKGMVAELDPHSSYMAPEDYGVFQGDTEGHFGGIGVEVDFATDSVIVIAPIEGSPAELAGVRSGDRIVAIDGQMIRDRSPAELVRTMRGVPGSRVLITVRREGVDHLLYFTLVRRIVTVTSISSKLMEGKIAYVRVKTFQSGTHAELLAHLANLRARAGGAFAGIVLDLRNNPGGLVNEASAVADEFLDGGVIYTTRRRGQVVDEVRADAEGVLRRGPAVVLVNEFSASAAELVAGALHDQHRASLVGAPTFGKGSVQTIVDLPGGAGLRLTTLRYYTPSGQAIQARGVTPDVLVGGAPGDYGIVREQNLDNHLPAVEGALTETPPPVLTPPTGAAAGKGPKTTEDVDHGVLRDVPADPRGGPDQALATAYAMVLKAAATPNAPARPAPH
ncbi:MAG TPA: S41 family peptidase [Polyangiaceae bacterium]|nr:S41 family peptidase [Polyangiaceae bacterium]